MNQPQKPALPTAAQIPVHSWEVRAGQLSNVVIAPAELIFIRLPNKQRTDIAFEARGSTEVIKLFEVGQYKRIKPIDLQATPVLQSIIQQ
ncbi:MAG: hypothetical protein EZS28_007379 [Streblomastix strix]|uniref:Uncharacterized protein n=1 Tax=Streblomastix strix TaxID=222440 RepID=A0A5J4WQ02_9EUKA|nr:MAG: hypothetical protein EZS28_007378 [Streblomastix strix]KAA6397095.1 MAG: hypothetical protein EZS28_007379 [Streblomastix strix]